MKTVRDATELADRVKAGAVDPIDLLEDAVDRIESINDRINAVITPLYDRARRRIDQGLPDGPFKGVPFLLKDLLAPMEGAPLESGSTFMEGYVPDHNSYLVDRYLDAGLVILGKTNTPEFGLKPTTEPDLHGPTRNPWDPDRIPGGSSGGSAAAVASGMVPMAHGNDGGGSLRIPASCCGLVGLKPTRARISMGPDFGDLMGGLVSEHALTRTVRDSARLLDATRGAVPGDPYEAPAPDRPYAEAMKRDPGSMTLGVLDEAPTDIELASDCREAVEESAALCESLGHEIERIELDLDVEMIQEAFTMVWAAGAAASIDGAAFETGREIDSEQFEPMTWMLYEMGQDFSSSDYMLAMTYLQRASREIQQKYFSDYDALMTPTVSKPPVEIGHFDRPDEPMEAFVRAAEFAPFTPLFNITGQPAVSLPLHWNDRDLPIGVQLAGGYGDEAELFRLASQLETADPWAEKLSPVNVYG